MSRKTAALLFILLIWLAACQQSKMIVPTRAPVAQIPTPLPPSPTALPPTQDLTRLTVTPMPTQPLPTRPPTATPTPIDPLINITSPDDGAQLILGSDIVVRGLAQIDATQVISVALLSANGRILNGSQAVPNAVGWEAGLTVPEFVSGSGWLRAAVLDSNGTMRTEDNTLVTLALDTGTSDQYLALYHPTNGETAVAGYFLFFDGYVRRPTGNAATISLWTDDCQAEVAKFKLTLNGSGYWQGSLGIPRDVVGPACAIAYFGIPGEDTWREVQIPINVYAADDPSAHGVQLTAPPTNSEIDAGQDLFLSGTAFNAESVVISIILDSGRIVAERTAIPDTYGYWELTLTLPFDVEGVAEITVTALDKTGAANAEAKTLITINPAPTPTPIPTATP